MLSSISVQHYNAEGENKQVLKIIFVKVIMS